MAKKQSRKHNEWKAAAGRAAKEQWLREGRSPDVLPSPHPMEVVITTFYTDLRRDVDNVFKPILDGLKQVIYVDDGDIYKLTTQRVDLKAADRIASSSELVLPALDNTSELVYIELMWEEK